MFRRGLFAHRFSFRASLAVGFEPRVRKQIEDSWRRLMQTSSQVVHHEGEQVRCSRCVGKVVITRKQFCGPLLGYAASLPRISSQEILVMRFVCSLRWHRYSLIVVGSTKQRAWRPPGSVFVKDIVLKDSLGRWITKSVFWRAPGGVGSTKQAVLVTPARATTPSKPQISRRVGAANSVLFIAEYTYYSDSIDQ